MTESPDLLLRRIDVCSMDNVVIALTEVTHATVVSSPALVIKKVQKTVDVPQVQRIDKIMDVSVPLHRKYHPSRQYRRRWRSPRLGNLSERCDAATDANVPKGAKDAQYLPGTIH